MSAGIETAEFPLLSRGYSTCALTTPSIVSESFPSSRAAAKAWSRLGPTWPTAPACARAWHSLHFWMKSVRPRWGSASVVPQPEAARARAARATRASSGVMSLRTRAMGLNAGGSLYVGAGGELAVEAASLDTLEAIRTNTNRERWEVANAGERRYVGDQPHRGPVSHAA